MGGVWGKLAGWECGNNNSRGCGGGQDVSVPFLPQKGEIGLKVISPATDGSGRVYSSNLLNTRQAFWPPNPKLLESAVLTSLRLATFGT